MNGSSPNGISNGSVARSTQRPGSIPGDGHIIFVEFPLPSASSSSVTEKRAASTVPASLPTAATGRSRVFNRSDSGSDRLKSVSARFCAVKSQRRL